MRRGVFPGSSLVTLADAGRYVATVLGGVVTGLLAGWLVVGVDRSFFDLHVAVWLFLVGWLATTAYLASKRVTSDVVGSTLYLAAVLVVSKPVVHYAPVVWAATAASGHRQSQLLLRGMGGLLVWGILAGVVAFGFVVLGRFAKSRARQTRVQRARVAVQDEDPLDED